MFSYQAYARLGSVYAYNPYINGPHAIALDHLYPYIGAKWIHTPSVYGPVFTAFSYLLASLTIATSVFAYKSITAVASLALVAVVWRCARLRDINPVRAAALVGLNPLLVLYGVGGGHNDLLMLLAVAGSIWALLASRERTGGVLMMVAIGVKLTAGLLLPFVFAAGGRRRGRARHDLLVGAGVGFTLIAALSFAVFGSGAFHLLATVRQSQSEGDWKSIPGVISARLGMPTVGHISQYLLAALFVVVCVWLVRRVWQGRTDWIDGAGWATLALLIASSSFLPWYVAWMLPLAALGHDHRLWRMAIVMTGHRAGDPTPRLHPPHRRAVGKSAPAPYDAAMSTSPPAPMGGPRELALMSVVAPVYNEEALIDEFYARTCAALTGVPFELVLVDDGSTDGTPLRLEQLAASDPRVRVVLLSRNFGHQTALTAGLDHARGRRRGDARRRPAGPAGADHDDARPLAGRLRRHLRRPRAPRG